MNAKKIPAFRSWKDMVDSIALARSQAAIDADLNALRVRLAAMGDNAALAKLKLYMKSKLAGSKAAVFKALCTHAAQNKVLAPTACL